MSGYVNLDLGDISAHQKSRNHGMSGYVNLDLGDIISEI
jgi:hypothetical protein